MARRLISSGHEIVVLGRNAAVARRLFPDADFAAADLTTPQPEEIWQSRLKDIDAVINASGVLQTGAKDDVEAVHHLAIAALVRACEACGIETFIQISSVGAKPDATTEFLRSKARGDDCVSSSSLSWFIVRPGLVIGPNAYGGTALIRMLASVPLVQPIAFRDAPIQTVSVKDLASVVLDAVEGKLPSRSEFDLVEDRPHGFGEIVREFRRWLGFAEAKAELKIPSIVLYGIAGIADALGYLGWRSPPRTTALRALSDGVLGDPGKFAEIDSRRLSNLHETLSEQPSTLQERWFARLYLAMPVTLAVLSLFWMLTGLTALFNLDVAIRMTGLSESASRVAVVSGAIADIILGATVLYRRWSRMVCWGMAFLTVLYIALGSAFRPDLWIDPLGPLLKAVPILVLALIATALLEDR